MLENPEKLRAIVKETGARSTDYEAPEDADTLCDRTAPYAEAWQPVADALWNGEKIRRAFARPPRFCPPRPAGGKKAVDERRRMRYC